MYSKKIHKLDELVDQFERLIIILITINLIVVIILQLLFTQDKFRVIFSKIEVMETMTKSKGSNDLKGEVLEAHEIPMQELSLSLDYEQHLPGLKVLVNGMKVANFSQKQITVKVKNNDLLEIDGSFYPYIIGVEIKTSSSAISHPKTGNKIFVNNSIESFGRIKIKL